MEALAAQWSLSHPSNQLILLRTPNLKVERLTLQPMSYGRPCDGAIISSSQLILLRMVGQGKSEAGVARAMWQGGRIAGASCANLRWE